MSDPIEKYSTLYCARNPRDAADRIEELEAKLEQYRYEHHCPFCGGKYMTDDERSWFQNCADVLAATEEDE